MGSSFTTPKSCCIEEWWHYIISLHTVRLLWRQQWRCPFLARKFVGLRHFALALLFRPKGKNTKHPSSNRSFWRHAGRQEVTNRGAIDGGLISTTWWQKRWASLIFMHIILCYDVSVSSLLWHFQHLLYSTFICRVGKSFCPFYCTWI